MSNKKCPCNKAYCQTHFKVKMVVMVKDQYKNSFSNTVFYNFYKENKKTETSLVIIMTKRLEANFKNAYNCIQFYNNNNQLIHTHHP